MIGRPSSSTLFPYTTLFRSEGLDRQLGAAVPAHEGAAVITVAMSLGIAQPQVEMLGQMLQQRLVGAAAEPVAMQEVQQRLAGRRGVPAAQGEAGGTGMGPGLQIHRRYLLLG